MLYKYFIVGCLLVIGLSATAQNLTLKDLDKKSAKTYKKALKCFSKNKQSEGIVLLEKVTTKYPQFSKASEKLVGIYLDKGENDKAVDLMERMVETLDSAKPKLYTSLSYAHEEKGHYDKAISAIDACLAKNDLSGELLAKIEHRREELVFRQAAYAAPNDLDPVKLGSNINTTDSEYHPALNADGTLMIYVKVGDGPRRNENLYQSKRMANDSFSIGQPIETLNTSAQEGAFTLSQNGRVLIFTACERQDSRGGCDLYISFRKGESWTPARNMGPVINSRYWDASPSLSSDNRSIYFSSKRPGGLGGSDIWMSRLNANNEWQTPINLGPTVNTAENDEAPYLHPDGKSLYFISRGHMGMGSYDIFLSKKTTEGWAQPQNLGYPINTKAREGGLFVDLTGHKAYFSSDIDFSDDQDKQEGGDIYYFKLPEEYRPELVSYLRMEVTDADTKGYINAIAELKDLKEDATVPGLEFNVSGGVLLTTIVPGEYALSISKKGYLFHSENLVLAEESTHSDPFLYQVELQPIRKEVVVEQEKQKPVILNNIFFASGSAELLPTSDSEIDKLIQLLSSNPELTIKILGHTDNVGPDQANLQLSTARAAAVYNRLLNAGFPSDRVLYEGRGENDPIADNETEEGRQRNRRTEFILIH